MYYVYLLRSIPNPDQTYIGYTEDLKARLQAHNHGQSPHAAKYKPWILITYLAFNDKARAILIVCAIREVLDPLINTDQPPAFSVTPKSM